MTEVQDDMQESEDIVSEFDNSLDGELKQSLQEENLSDGDYDYQQGFEGAPSMQPKDSITKFYRYIVNLMHPMKVVRAANFVFGEKKNTKIFLDFAKYNRLWKNDMVANYLEHRAVIEASASMGFKGFLLTNIMTQRRVVKRDSGKPSMTGGFNKPKQGE